MYGKDGFDENDNPIAAKPAAPGTAVGPVGAADGGIKAGACVQPAIAALLVDESGSMRVAHESVVSGVNAFVQEIAKDPGPGGTFVSIKFFDSAGHRPTVRTKREYAHAHETAPLLGTEYNPSGMTPLLDAIGQTVADLEAKDAELGGHCRVTLVIQTDGAENSSQEFTLPQIKTILEGKQKEGWQVVFLGADLDKFSKGDAAAMGLAAGSSFTYDRSKSAAAFASVARGTSAYRSGGSSAVGLNAADLSQFGAKSVDDGSTPA